MIKSRTDRTEIDLRCRATTPMPDQHDCGPLVADDYGMCMVTSRKRFRRSRPIHYYFFAWSDVTGYRLSPRLGPPGPAGASTSAHDTELTIYTRRGQHSWQLALSEAKVRTLLGRWLARIPRVT
jgi:hypothetical protein